jgi:hypothetical protein
MEYIEAGLLRDIDEDDWSAVDESSGRDGSLLNIHHRGMGRPTSYSG